MKNVYHWFVVLCLVAGCSSGSTKEQPTRPNIVLILADDLGWSDIGCFGSEVQTPTLDRMAKNGLRFTQVYNTSKCFPSRACLLTGQYAQRTGYHRKFDQPMKGALTLGEVLKQAGYTTLWSGKHHSRENPVTRGFDHYSGLFDGASNHFNPGKQREGEGKPAQKRNNRMWSIEGEVHQPYTPPNSDFYTTDAFTDYALDWLDKYKDNENPFFLYLAYTAPHDPLMAWPEDIKKYEGKYEAGYEPIRAKRFERQKAMGLIGEDETLSVATARSWQELSEDQKQEESRKMTVYAAMIDRMDQNIARLQAKLRELKKEENTLFLFVSDNGASAEVVNIPGSGEIGEMTRWTSLGPDWANVSNTPLRFFKNYSHEGGIKTPMVAYWPKGISGKNKIVNTPLHFIDFLPTLADLAQVDYPDQYQGETLQPVDGKSFLPLLQGNEMQRTEPLFWQWAKGKAVREGDWKLVSFQGDWELYNLKEDMTESENVAEKHPEVVSRLAGRYEMWWKGIISKNE